MIICTGYKQELIENYLDMKKLGIKIKFSIEKTPLGTGGAIKKAGKFIKDKSFIVINGDTITNIDLKKLVAKQNSIAAIELRTKFGVLETNDDKIKSINEIIQEIENKTNQIMNNVNNKKIYKPEKEEEYQKLKTNIEVLNAKEDLKNNTKLKKMDTVNIFNENVEAYEAWYEKYTEVYLSEVSAIKEHLLKLPENIRGIEVGIGTGRFAQVLGIKEGM